MVLTLLGMFMGIIIDDALGLSYCFKGITELLAVILCCVLTKKSTGEKLTKHINRGRFDPTVPVMFLIGGYGIRQLLMQTIDVIACRFTTVKPDGHHNELLVFILSSVIFAPLCEEIAFRFCNVSVLSQSFGKTSVILISAVMFALPHCYNFSGTAYVLLGGILYAYVYVTTGSLIYNIIVHMIHNALGWIDLTQVNFAGQKIETQVNGFTVYSTPWVIVNCVFVAAGAAYWILYYRPKYCKSKQSLLTEQSAETAVMTSR